MPISVVDVAVSVVRSEDGRVLLAERTARQVAAGFWELPGGKIDPGETPEQAAARELEEEVGIVATGLSPWISYEHAFRTKRVRLHLFRVEGWRGSPHGREGQRLAWVDPAVPAVGPVLPSNDRALFALALPDAYMVADFGAQGSADCVLASLHRALSGGASLIRLRVAAVPPGQAASLLARVAALAADYPGASILTASTMDARRAALAGVHSTAHELRRLAGRPAVRVWAATCHDDADLQRAVALGADLAVLSPILPDSDRPHQAPIGWNGLRRCAAAYPIALYAQGGLTAADLAAVRRAGAAGLVLDCLPAERPASRHRGAWAPAWREVRV